MAEHRAAGRRIVIVSASPEEIVVPIGRLLGVDDVIASRALLTEDRRYTGQMDFYAYGPFKVEAIEALAAEHDIDLAESWAYSDSYTDLPMMLAVGHPVAVNPDRPLLKAARDGSGRSGPSPGRCACGTGCRPTRAPPPGWWRASARWRSARGPGGDSWAGLRRPQLLGGECSEGDEDGEDHELLHEGTTLLPCPRRRRRGWRRWTGIEPAGQGSPAPTALKAAEPTRRSDTSGRAHYRLAA